MFEAARPGRQLAPPPDGGGSVEDSPQPSVGREPAELPRGGPQDAPSRNPTQATAPLRPADGVLTAAAKACASLDARALGCGMELPGSLCPPVPTDVDGCLAGCRVSASCELLGGSLCDQPFSPEGPTADAAPSPEERLAACLRNCAFVCDDDVAIVARWRCDGTAHCQDGSDEVACPTRRFFCEDGSRIPSSWVCDGQNDCPSAADERSCAEEVVPLLCER